MNTPGHNELCDFYQFVGDKVNNGGASLSPEEVLDEWRMVQPAAAAAQEEVAALQEAIDDLDNGDTGIPYEDFDRDFRARRNLPRPS